MRQANVLQTPQANQAPLGGGLQASAPHGQLAQLAAQANASPAVAAQRQLGCVIDTSARRTVRRTTAMYYTPPRWAPHVKRKVADEPLAPAPALGEVMAQVDDLAAFTRGQDRLQGGMASMDGKQSAGFEFEFASFTQT